MLVDEHHVHSDIGLHLNNSAVLAVLSGHLKSKVGAGKPTAANSDFLALDGSWIAVGILYVYDISSVHAGDGRKDGMGAGSCNNLVRRGKNRVVNRDFFMDNLDIELFKLGLVVLNKSLQTGLKLRLSRQVESAAELVAFVKGHIVALYGSNAGGFHTAGAATDDDYILGFLALNYTESMLFIGLGIDGAGQLGKAPPDTAYAFLIAADARTDILFTVFHQLLRQFRVGDKGTAHHGEVCTTGLDEAFGSLGGVVAGV